MADSWTVLCQRLVPGVLRARDWKLIPQDELLTFIAEVSQAIAQGTVRPRPAASPAETVQRATVHVYCRHLYQASGENGDLRQRRAFEEIGRYLQGVACHFEQNVAVAQACAQSALQIVWEERDQVREPGSFLRWVEQVVYHEIKRYWKKAHRRHEVTMSQLTPAGEDEERAESFWEALSSVPPPDEDVANRQVRDQLWAEVRRVLAGNERYQAVIIGYYLYELSPPDLAELLETPVRNVYVLKSRALARLREDEEFVRRFAAALETLPGETP